MNVRFGVLFEDSLETKVRAKEHLLYSICSAFPANNVELLFHATTAGASFELANLLIDLGTKVHGLLTDDVAGPKLHDELLDLIVDKERSYVNALSFYTDSIIIFHSEQNYREYFKMLTDILEASEYEKHIYVVNLNKAEFDGSFLHFIYNLNLLCGNDLVQICNNPWEICTEQKSIKRKSISKSFEKTLS